MGNESTFCLKKQLNISNKKVILCHGSPWDRDVYIYPDASQNIIDKMVEYDSDFDSFDSGRGRSHFDSSLILRILILILRF